MPDHWVISPFNYAYPDFWQRVWQLNVQEGFISIGWHALQNVSTLSKAQIFDRHRRAFPESKERGAINDSKMLYRFWHDIKIGHVVIARRGCKCIAAIGKVISKPYYRPSKAKSSFAPEPAFPNHLDVDWFSEPRVRRSRNQFGDWGRKLIARFLGTFQPISFGSDTILRKRFASTC